MAQYFPNNQEIAVFQELACCILESAIISCTRSVSKKAINQLLELLIYSLCGKASIDPQRVANLAQELRDYGRSLELFERLFACTSFSPGQFNELIVRLIRSGIGSSVRESYVALRVLMYMTRHYPETMLDFDLLQKTASLVLSIRPEIQAAAFQVLGEATSALQTCGRERLLHQLQLVCNPGALCSAVASALEVHENAPWLQSLGEAVGVC